MKIDNLDQYISRPKPKSPPSKKVEANYSNTALFFGTDGKPVKTKKESDILAKTHMSGKSLKYYIKVNVMGDPANPFDVHYLEESLRRARQQGGDLYKFVSCPKDIFDAFLSFLQTKNKSYYNMVLRGI